MHQKLEKKWFIAQIKPNSYELAIRNLERQGFETFVPKMEITRRQKNTFHVKKVYVFPGYIFVCFDLHDIIWSKINSTYGVSKILTFHKIPSEIPSDLILELKTKYENNDNRKGIEKLQIKLINFVTKYTINRCHVRSDLTKERCNNSCASNGPNSASNSFFLIALLKISKSLYLSTTLPFTKSSMLQLKS